MKMNELGNLDEINKIDLGTTGEIIRYPKPFDEGGNSTSG